MTKNRKSYLLLSLASGAVVSAAVLPGCSGVDKTPSPSGTAGSGGNSACGGHPCGTVVNPGAGTAQVATPGLVVAPPDGGTGGIAGTDGVGSSGGAGGTDGRPCRGSPCGIIIQPHAGAAGVAGAAGDAGIGGGVGGPCGGHLCGSLPIPPGSAGEAGATS